MRFLPQLKARYDYGLMVFILTYSLVSVSSYRDDEILDIAEKRVITILAGALISVFVSIFVWPVWAGDDLHKLVAKNIEKLGNSIEGFGNEYFKTQDGEDTSKSFLPGYRSVLNSKQSEESLANFARWEPCHGAFRFHHPWQQYLKIGSLSRECAYHIDALNSFLISTKSPLEVRRKIQEPCINMSKETGKALKELAISIQNMIPPSSSAYTQIDKSKVAAINLKSMVKSNSLEGTNFFEVIPVVTVASLLLDVVSCTEKLAESIQELSTLAKFKNKDNKVVAEDSNSPCEEEDHPQETCSCENNGLAPLHIYHDVVITINPSPTNLSTDGNGRP
ncbi:hypothetical protein PIB30_025390 [Stylosanthes scabra]|uniref:Aluminum-activated malate transporter n=1 Tax=Stylosanthes scabra TaxID=79078 RepID=A0ABU6QAI9_9FABA|nr:hypothetical protein [Stylosanthes scabra]